MKLEEVAPRTKNIKEDAHEYLRLGGSRTYQGRNYFENRGLARSRFLSDVRELSRKGMSGKELWKKTIKDLPKHETRGMEKIQQKINQLKREHTKLKRDCQDPIMPGVGLVGCYGQGSLLLNGVKYLIFTSKQDKHNFPGVRYTYHTPIGEFKKGRDIKSIQKKIDNEGISGIPKKHTFDVSGPFDAAGVCNYLKTKCSFDIPGSNLQNGSWIALCGW
ncbi:MAG: hypothetical protein V3U75_12570 [Methylococcaceae bacterium]